MLLHRGQGVGANAIAGLAPAAWFRYGRGITVVTGVSQWDDQSGNGRHLTQATGLNQPARQTDGSILFDGTNHFLKTGAFTLNQPETVYLLFKQVSWTSVDAILDGFTANTLLVQQTNGGASPQIRLFAGTGTSSNSDLAVGAYGALSGVFNGASSILRVNNGTEVTGSVGAANAGGVTLGATGGSLSPSNIQVKELIIFSGAHDAAQRSLVQQYLYAVNAQ